MKPQRIQLSRRKGFDLQKVSHELNGLRAVKCARPCRFGNPFVIRPENQQAAFYSVRTKREAISEHLDALHRIRDGGYLLTNPITGFEISIDDIKRELRGKNLACWCKTTEACHCDALLKIANETAKDANRFSRTLGKGTKSNPVTHWGHHAPRHITKT